MDTFKSHALYEDAVADAKKKLAKMKGKQVSFTHQASGEKVTGTYKGMKQMGGRSYAHIKLEREHTEFPLIIFIKPSRFYY